MIALFSIQRDAFLISDPLPTQPKQKKKKKFLLLALVKPIILMKKEK